MKATEILDKFNVPYIESGHEHCRSGWCQVDCPHCTPDAKHWRLGYNTAHGYWNCWSCGPLKSLTVWQELTGLTFSEVKRLLNDLDIEETPTEHTRTKGKLVLPHRLGDLQQAHIRYLRQRRFDPDELVKLWGIRGIGFAVKLAWRIFIPITQHDKMVSWTTRKITDTEPRYWSAKPEQETVSHKHILFGEDYARHAIIICEGPFDVFHIGPGAVCTFGLTYTPEQFARMTRYPIRVVCFDSDFDAQLRARKLCDELSLFRGETFNAVLDAKDPGSASKKEICRLRRRFLENRR